MNIDDQIPGWVSQAALLIETDIRKHLTIREIAFRVGTNSNSLKQKFREVYGVGPYQYLSNVRLKKATELLLGKDQPLKAIAKQVGYKTASSFIAAFRKKYGTTPTLWKKSGKVK